MVNSTDERRYHSTLKRTGPLSFAHGIEFIRMISNQFNELAHRSSKRIEGKRLRALSIACTQPTSETQRRAEIQ